MFVNCYACGKQSEILGTLGRRDECPHCGAELHWCKQCRFYEPQSGKECREPEAEIPRDKDRANFCDHFQLASPGARDYSEADKAKAAFDALFTKKK